MTPTPTIVYSPTSTPKPTPTENVIEGTVIIWHSWEEMQRSALFRRITSFQARYPDVQFDVLYIPSIDLRASYEAAMAENYGPTILIGSAEWGPELYERGWVAELTPYVSQELLATLNPAALGAGKYGDKLLCLPLSEKGVVLYRNKSLVPNAALNFDSLVTLAHTASEAGNIGALLERSFYYSAGHLYGLGGDLMTSDGLPDFNKDDYRYSLEWLELLRAFDRVGGTEYQSDNDLNKFLDGRVGFIIESTSVMYALAGELTPVNLSIDPWPAYKDGRMAGFVQAESAFLSPIAVKEEDQASWLFLQSLLSPESQAAISGVGLIPAIQPAVMQDKNERIGDPFVEQAMVALNNGAAYPPLSIISLYSTQFDSLLRAVLFQGADPKIALQSSYDALQQQISNLAATPTPLP